MLLSQGKPPIYDRAALKLSSDEKSQLEKEGRKPHYRFLLEDKTSIWQDQIKGEIKINPKHTSDPIIKRENGVFTYMLPSAIDDIDFGITHVVRGDDHLDNTAVQIQMFEAIEKGSSEKIAFAHLPLLKIKDGQLSKRKGEMTNTVAYFREHRIDPIIINSYLAKIGTSDDINLSGSMADLIENFSVKKFGKSVAIFDNKEVERLNVKFIHNLSYESAKKAYPNFEFTEDLWNVARGNLEKIEDLELWREICATDFSANIDEEDKEFISLVASCLPDEVLDENSWDKWLSAIKEKTDRKGKALFMPIRKAITGIEHGPELKILLPIIGREKILGRLKV